ncbi:MAG: YIP1 family protein [Acidobacteriota bacterium]|nr:YIP1 family protein [Acidobacteriota bacterium]
MRLIQFLYAPGRVFGELKGNNWVLPLGAAAIIFLLSAILMLNAIGPDAVMNRASQKTIRSHEPPADLDEPWSTLAFAISFGALASIASVLVYAGVASWVLRLIHERTNYGIVLAVCSYAAYANQLVGFVLRLAVVIYHRLSGVQLTVASIKTDASIFLGRNLHTGRLYSLASSLDLLTLGFIVLFAWGLAKSTVKIQFSRAALAAAVPWAAWTLVKLALAGGARQ